MTKVDMHIPGKSDLDVSFDGSRKIHQEAPFERYISRVCKTSGWKLVNLWLVAVESKSTHPTIFLTAGAAIIQPLI